MHHRHHIFFIVICNDLQDVSQMRASPEFMRCSPYQQPRILRSSTNSLISQFQPAMFARRYLEDPAGAKDDFSVMPMFPTPHFMRSSIFKVPMPQQQLEDGHEHRNDQDQES